MNRKLTLGAVLILTGCISSSPGAASLSGNLIIHTALPLEELILLDSSGTVSSKRAQDINGSTAAFKDLAPGNYRVVKRLGSIPLSNWITIWEGWETGLIIRERQQLESLSTYRSRQPGGDPRTLPLLSPKESPVFLSDTRAVIWSDCDQPVMAAGDLAGGWHFPEAPFYRKIHSSLWMYSVTADSGSFLEYQLSIGPKSGQVDPNNHSTPIIDGKKTTNSHLYMPQNPSRKWMMPPEVSGKNETFELTGTKPEFKRLVTVHLPPGYPEKGKVYPTIYFHDGNMHQNAQITAVLDHLFSERLCRSFVAVLVNNAGSWRNAEFLPESQVPGGWYPRKDVLKAIAEQRVPPWWEDLPWVYLDTWKEKLIPLIEKKYQVGKTPRDRGVIGQSNGSVITFILLNRFPELFGYAACQSGFSMNMDLRQIGTKVPLRLWHSFGSFEQTPEDFQRIIHYLQPKLEGRMVKLKTHQFPGGHNPMAWALELPDILQYWWNEEE